MLRSRMIKNPGDIDWIISQIPFGAKKIEILFDAKKHGWHDRDFHRICDGHPNPTIIVMKSKA
jgi:hypothetical protein